MQWSDSIPLLVAFVGVMSAAFFAIVKTKRERLWLDRYVTLVSLLESLEVMQTKASYDQADEIGITVRTGEEMAQLQKDWAPARRNIQSKIVKLRMLFKEGVVDELVEIQKDIDIALHDLYESIPPEYQEGFGKIYELTGSAIEAAIGIARKECL